MGRNAKPIAIAKRTNAGARVAKAILKARDAAEPKIESAKLRCPARLSAEAKKEWKRIAKLYTEFEDDNLINDLDVDTLMVYCEALIVYIDATERIKETSAVYLSPANGEPKINPWVKVSQDASETMRKLSDMLMLNPLARARAGLARVNAEKDKVSPMAKFLKDRNAK